MQQVTPFRARQFLFDIARRPDLLFRFEQRVCEPRQCPLIDIDIFAWILKGPDAHKRIAHVHNVQIWCATYYDLMKRFFEHGPILRFNIVLGASFQ
jgi:hypothetical protein